MAKTVTMKDIADNVGVSTVTVSNALTDKGGVSDEIREKIKSAADRMGYTYNTSSKSMFANLNYTIGVILSRRFVKEDTDAFYTKLHQNIVQKLIPYNFFTQLEIVEMEEEKAEKAPNLITTNRVDGVIVLGQMEKEYLKMLKTYSIPLLYFDFEGDVTVDDSINGDGMHGVYELTNYLFDMGHKNIGFVGSITQTVNILERYLGYCKAVLEKGLFPKKEWLLEDRDANGEFCDIKLPVEMPTAFVCNCDQVAYLFVNKLQSEGYKVPGDISVVGYDNYIYSTICQPQLTTYAVDVNAMATAAAETIIMKIKNEDYMTGARTIRGNMIIRQSVAKHEL